MEREPCGGHVGRCDAEDYAEIVEFETAFGDGGGVAAEGVVERLFGDGGLVWSGKGNAALGESR